ncbi:hypothetical protein CP061683_0875A, partial [Chlamydia psittaci 06-1683]
MVEINDAR